MLQLHSSRPWISPRITKVTKISPFLRDSTVFPCQRIQFSAVRVINLFIKHGEKSEASSQGAQDKIALLKNLDISENLTANLLKVEISDNFQVYKKKTMMVTLSSFILLRLMQQNYGKAAMIAVQDVLSFMFRSFATSSLPFACISNPLNKPTPLRLGVSLPSMGDIRWSFGRMIYLFNLQLERNVATFFLVLLALCFSFVMIGGFLFFKFSVWTE